MLRDRFECLVDVEGLRNLAHGSACTHVGFQVVPLGPSDQDDGGHAAALPVGPAEGCAVESRHTEIKHHQVHGVVGSQRSKAASGPSTMD